MSSIEKHIESAWQSRGWLACLLWPVSLLYRSIILARHLAYRWGLLRVEPMPLPVVVVGNLSVGGTGKTPLCAYLATYLKNHGWRPAIVSRGYGGQRFDTPHRVVDGDTAEQVGDEPLMLFEQTGVPVCVCVKRADAVRELAASTNANIVLSDDGLQHLAMSRVAQIVVVDAGRGFGNRWLLPAGPLRDSIKRLATVDLLALQRVDGMQLHHSLSTGPAARYCLAHEHQSFSIVPTCARDLFTGQRVKLEQFFNTAVHAVAGIGHPQRFFELLASYGINVIPHPLPDHHAFVADDISFNDLNPVLVTSKDAVKLRTMVARAEHVYEICTEITISSELQTSIDALERSLAAHVSKMN